MAVRTYNAQVRRLCIDSMANPLVRTADRSVDRRVHSLIHRAFWRREALSFFEKRLSAISLSAPSKRHPFSNPKHLGKYRNPHFAESLSHVEDDGKEDRSIIRGLIDELRETRETILRNRSAGSEESRTPVAWSRPMFPRSNFDKETWPGRLIDQLDCCRLSHIHAIEKGLRLMFHFYPMTEAILTRRPKRYF